VVVQEEATSLALEASMAALSYLSLSLFNILKQYLKVAIDEFALLESISVKVHLGLTCSLSKK
jgi:hypothetical protein